MISIFILLKIFEVGIAAQISWLWLIPMIGLKELGSRVDGPSVLDKIILKLEARIKSLDEKIENEKSNLSKGK